MFLWKAHGSPEVVESVTTTESTNTNVTEQPAREQSVTDTRVTIDQTDSRTAAPGDNQTLLIIGGLVALALVCLMVMLAGKKSRSNNIERTSTTQYRG